MVFPQETSSAPTGFTSAQQARYPEAYALARQVDQFGREQVALFRVTIDNHRRPHLFRELDALPSLLEKTTGHTLHTPGLTSASPIPLSLKVEALALATWDTTTGFIIDSFRHPIQSRIDLSIGATKRVGHYLKEGLKLLVNTRDPNDRISRDMVETLDTVATNLDRLFTTWVQKHNPHHNPQSPSTTVGGFALDIALWETGCNLLKGTKGLKVIEKLPLTSERLALQSQRALQREALALERLTQPALRSGIVSDKALAKLAVREIRVITLFKLPPVKAGSELVWLSENAAKIQWLKQVKGGNFDRFLKPAFKNQPLSETQIRRLLNYSGFKTYNRPIGLPQNCIVEFSKKNGGMIYRKLGTTEKQNILVRVCPGTRKENAVKAMVNGSKKNGRWHQQTPYVVQRRGEKHLTKHGEWIDDANELTHIPLQEYQFRGW